MLKYVTVIYMCIYILLLLQVAAKLARQQRAWEMKFEREKAQARESHSAKMLSTTMKARKTGAHDDYIAEDPGDITKYLLPLERREMIYAAKRDARKERKEMREAQQKQRQQAQEEERKMKLLKARVPDSESLYWCIRCAAYEGP